MIEIFLDIETIPTQREDIIKRVIEGVTPPANYKKEETIAQWWATEGDAKKQAAIERTALNGSYGEIISITFAVDEGPIEVIGRDGSEAEQLRRFALALDDKCKKADRGSNMWAVIAKWIGHNIEEFDLRFLWQRSKVCEVPFPFQLPLRRYSQMVYDTMKEWSGQRDFISQKDLEMVFQIQRVDPLPNGGADVWQAYKEGRLDDIYQHNYVDVENLRKCYRRMTA